MDARVMELADGRELAWGEMGDPDGYPVLLFHGTPGSRHQVLVDPGPASAAGVRVVAPDRPGYGLSTFHEDRTLAGWADDVIQLPTTWGSTASGSWASPAVVRTRWCAPGSCRSAWARRRS